MSTAIQTPRTTPRPSLRRDWSLSATLAGFVAVVVSYAGPLLVVLEAARAAELDTAQTASWVWAISVGSGITCVLCSWWFRQPVMVAWSIPGAALLITSLGNYTFSDAIGAYIVSAILGLVLGVTGLFGKILDAIPKPITAAVLAGVLLPFSIQVAPSVVENPAPAGALVIGYLLGKRFLPRYAVFVAMGMGVAVAGLTGAITSVSPEFGLTVPTLTMPTFSLGAIAGISIPLLIVTAAGQNAPGLAMMKTANFPPNDRALLGASGIASILFAPAALTPSTLRPSPPASPRARRPTPNTDAATLLASRAVASTSCSEPSPPPS